ncbi:MAG: hypothetical protein AAGF13_06375 [Pseudomonadota bacterium]
MKRVFIVSTLELDLIGNRLGTRRLKDPYENTIAARRTARIHHLTPKRNYS